MKTIVRFQGVSKTFEGDEDEGPALAGITFAIQERAFVFLTGPSGAGKSTLVRLLYGECHADDGEATVCGKNISGLDHHGLAMLRRNIGIVHQDFNLILRKSARDNVALALEIAGVSRSEALRRAGEALARVKMTDHAHKIAVSLSGGEKQRVAMARALVIEPELLVADEPTGNLDPELTEEIFALLAAANREGTTVVVATHDVKRVDASGQPVLYLRNGRLVAARGNAASGLTTDIR